jgi:hypothetical protein
MPLSVVLQDFGARRKSCCSRPRDDRDFTGQMSTVEGFDSETHPRKPMKWSVVIDDGASRLFLTEHLEHADK